MGSTTAARLVLTVMPMQKGAVIKDVAVSPGCKCKHPALTANLRTGLFGFGWIGHNGSEN